MKCLKEDIPNEQFEYHVSGYSVIAKTTKKLLIWHENSECIGQIKLYPVISESCVVVYVTPHKCDAMNNASLEK